MSSIRILDSNTIEKIAAGEIIDRPSSIVKELIENSIDAGAKNITIEIKDGGKSYIRITDDGSGIENSDLDLAFKSHATSKINSLDDLYVIRTLGFRGEALASVSHVSKMEVMTKMKDSLKGIHALIEEGVIVSKEIIGCPKGTTMIVKDLFYNLPVRKRFLKSDSIESTQIMDIVYKIALGNADISFNVIKDSKIVLKTSRNNKTLEHIYSILGKEFKNNLIQISYIKDDLSISGYISNNKLYRSNRSHQYIFVNGRYIINKVITNTIEDNYKSIIPLKRFPAFILFIDVDPKTIDINIHPTKQEIRFIREDELKQNLSQIVHNYLNDSIAIPKMDFKNNSTKSKKSEFPLLFEDTQNDEKDILVKDLRSISDEMNFRSHVSTKKDDILYEIENQTFFVEEKIIDKDEKENNNNEIIADHIYIESTKDILSKLKPISVIFNTYILAEDSLNKRLYFIDQHAAHERVMYEKYLDEFKREKINSQQLISPVILELTNMEMNKFIGNTRLFKSLGFEISEFGNNSVAIRGVPLVFGKPDIKRIFYEILDATVENINTSYDTNIEKIMKLACTNAIKSGDKMSKIEILSLFDQLKNTKNPNSCPHGRPTILQMTKTDIEKAFLRIM